MIQVQPTGRSIGFAGLEFIATFPNSEKTVFWVPSKEEAEKFANKLWRKRSYYKLSRETADEFFGGWHEKEFFLAKHFPLEFQI